MHTLDTIKKSYNDRMCFQTVTRRAYTEEERMYVFKRDGGLCKLCRKQLVFSNRRKDERGAWEMGHRRADKKGGSNHLRNIVALCWKHNREQETTSFAEEERKYEYDSNIDKAKDFLGFNTSTAHRSKTMEGQLQDFKQRVKNFSLDRAKEVYKSMVPQARRFLNGDNSYEIYYKKCMIIEQVFRL